jgi:hypothetical protein
MPYLMVYKMAKFMKVYPHQQCDGEIEYIFALLCSVRGVHATTGAASRVNNEQY